MLGMDGGDTALTLMIMLLVVCSLVGHIASEIGETRRQAHEAKALQAKAEIAKAKALQAKANEAIYRMDLPSPIPESDG